jgi:hypothetical protein
LRSIFRFTPLIARKERSLPFKKSIQALVYVRIPPNTEVLSWALLGFHGHTV